MKPKKPSPRTQLFLMRTHRKKHKKLLPPRKKKSPNLKIKPDFTFLVPKRNFENLSCGLPHKYGVFLKKQMIYSPFATDTSQREQAPYCKVNLWPFYNLTTALARYIKVTLFGIP